MEKNQISHFRNGSFVTWSANAPKDWHYTWTPEPMMVVSSRWTDGTPTKYALMFGPNGLDFKPGWIITIEYDADTTKYYDPPLSLLLGKKRIQKEIHEMWLIPADQ